MQIEGLQENAHNVSTQIRKFPDLYAMDGLGHTSLYNCTQQFL